jgi:hypothetical protein
VHVDDVENAAKLIALTIAGMTAKTRFVPQ